MLLTTLERCLQTVELNQPTGTAFDVNSYTAQMRRDYAREIAAASQIVERLINVSLPVQSFTELLSPTGRTILWPQHVPIRSVTSLEHDPMGMFSSSMGYSTMSAGNEYTVDPDKKRIHLLMPYPVMDGPPVKQYRLTFLGGYAYHTTRTVYAIADHAGTPTAGTYDQTSGNKVVVQAVDLAGSLVTFSPDIGTFSEGDVLECGTGKTITLGACVEESIVNNYASLEAEVIRQVNYAYERRRSAGKHSTTSGSGVTTYVNGYEVLNSLKEACDNFQYYGVGY